MTNRFNSSTFQLKTVTETMVAKVINNISTNARGVDGITLDMILLTLPRTLGVITAMVNCSIRTAVFPEAWKEALVKPIPKVRDPTELKDIRPISILPFLSKIIEKIVCTQMTEYLEANNILPQKQSGFRASRGTATALMDVIDDILAGQDRGEGTILVLLDFSRAFESINTSLMISKLTYYGFNDATVKWFTSYLTGRTQRVEVCDSNGVKRTSSNLPVARGVPQGSILGPILFILYSADITKCIKYCNYHLYADDLQIYLSFKPNDTSIAVNRINKDLDALSRWAEESNLVLNPLKTKFLLLGTKTQISRIQARNPKVQIGNAIVEQTTETRNLGVLMDDDLKFENHVLSTAKTCFYRLKVLYQVRQYLSVDLRVHLCESLILSKLNYADTVFGECLLARTKKLIQRVQNACARFCFHIPRRAHVTPYLNANKLMNMESRRLLHFSSLLFGIIKFKKPIYLFRKLDFSERLLRLASRLICPRHSTAAFRGSFRYSATKCWNNIPPPIRNATSVNSFKDKYKKYLLLQQLSNK